MEAGYTTETGDYLVIMITGIIDRLFIAQVTGHHSLQMKVTETGEYANLQYGDYIIQEFDTEQLQRDIANGTCVFLANEKAAGRDVYSGLKSLEIYDNIIQDVLPITE